MSRSYDLPSVRTISEPLLVAILTFGVFGIITTEMGVVGLIPEIANRFGVSVATAGWTVSIFALFVCIAAPVLPMLCSGLNRRNVMLAALGTFTASNITAIVTDDFWVLLLARAIPGTLHPIYVAMAFTLAAKAAAASGHDPSQGVARVFTGVSAGMVLGVPFSSFVAAHFSYEAAMGAFTLATGLCLTATVVFVPSMPVKRSSFGAHLKSLRSKTLWLAAAAFACVNGGIFGFFSFLTEYLTVESKLSPDTVSLVLLGYDIANVFGGLAAGRLYAHAKKYFTLAMPVLLLAAYAFLYAVGSSAALTGATLLTIGFLAGAANIPGQGMLLTAVPHAPDLANGFFLASANLGTAFGTAVCGSFLAFGGPRAALFGSFIALIAAAILVTQRVKHPTGSEYE